VTFLTGPSIEDSLGSLSVSAGTLSPRFDPSVSNYVLKVPHGTKAFRLLPKTSDPYAEQAINGWPLKPGRGSKITPIKESESTKMVVTVRAVDCRAPTSKTCHARDYTVVVISAGCKSCLAHAEKQLETEKAAVSAKETEISRCEASLTGLKTSEASLQKELAGAMVRNAGTLQADLAKKEHALATATASVKAAQKALKKIEAESVLGAKELRAAISALSKAKEEKDKLQATVTDNQGILSDAKAKSLNLDLAWTILTGAQVVQKRKVTEALRTQNSDRAELTITAAAVKQALKSKAALARFKAEANACNSAKSVDTKASKALEARKELLLQLMKDLSHLEDVESNPPAGQTLDESLSLNEDIKMTKDAITQNLKLQQLDEARSASAALSLAKSQTTYKISAVQIRTDIGRLYQPTGGKSSESQVSSPLTLTLTLTLTLNLRSRVLTQMRRQLSSLKLTPPA